MSDIATYEKIKDSGIEWIGRVPSHWRVHTLYQLVTQVKEKNSNLQEKNLLSLSYGKIKRKDIDSPDGLLPASFDGYNIIETGDIVLRLTDLQNDHTSLRVGLATERGIITSAYTTLRPMDTSNSKYLYYLLHAFDLKKGFYGMGSGVRQGLNYAEVKELRVVLPSQDEQNAIVRFLDNQCGQIDSIIEDAKSSLEEYKKWKASIIFEAVTKGIVPGVEMRDSGLREFGNIPKTWYITKTLHCLSMPITDGPHTTPEFFDSGVPFVSAEAISCGNGKIAFDHIRGYISEEFYQECCKKYIPQIDDVYMIKSGATTGKVAIVDTDIKFTIWSPIAVFRADKSRILPKFLFYALQSPSYQTQVALGWTYGTQQNIGMRTLETLKLCVPSLEEQKQIVAYLDRRCSEMDALISEKEALVSDLEVYKRSLVFETVTGKRKVV